MEAIAKSNRQPRARLVAAAIFTLVVLLLSGVDTPTALAADEVPAAVPPAPASAAPAPDATAVAAGTVTPAAPAVPPPPPYSLPWQLRPLAAATAIRLDNSVALYDAAGQGGTTVANMFLASYKLTPTLAPMVRLGFVRNDAPAMAADGSSFVNPILGLTYAKRVESIRYAGFVGGTLPIGMGGGDMPDAGAAGANAAGIAARSAMDNAMFAVNYFTAILGGGVGYVDHKFTLQAEVTLLQLFRVRGSGGMASPSATDSTRTNSTAGIHAGYFVLPMLSLGGELRYQRWLTTPTTAAGADIPSANKDTVTVAIGPRGHFKFGNGMWFRPGIAYVRALDEPLSNSSYNMIQVDLPVVF